MAVTHDAIDQSSEDISLPGSYAEALQNKNEEVRALYGPGEVFEGPLPKGATITDLIRWQAERAVEKATWRPDATEVVASTHSLPEARTALQTGNKVAEPAVESDEPVQLTPESRSSIDYAREKLAEQREKYARLDSLSAAPPKVMEPIAADQGTLSRGWIEVARGEASKHRPASEAGASRRTSRPNSVAKEADTTKTREQLAIEARALAEELGYPVTVGRDPLGRLAILSLMRRPNISE